MQNKHLIKILMMCLIALTISIGSLTMVSSPASAASTVSHSPTTKESPAGATKPAFGSISCNHPPGGWLKVVFSGGYACFGGGGSGTVDITNVYEIDTGNNWGHLLFGDIPYRTQFGPNNIISVNNHHLTYIWLYE